MLLETYKCKNCGEITTENDILDLYGGDEDQLVVIGSSGLCPSCYDYACLPDYVVNRGMANNHSPECQCNRCYYGDDADIWLHYPNEY